MAEINKNMGIKVICETCQWESPIYWCDEEGGEDCAKTSAVIESRLGHLKDTAIHNNGKIETHKIRLDEVFKD